MKRLILPFLLAISMLSFGQTQFFGSTELLKDVFSNKLELGATYSVVSDVTALDANTCFSFISETKEISIGSTSYTKRNEGNSALVLFNSKYGTIQHISELGDDKNRVAVHEQILMPNGNIFVFAYTYLSEEQPVMLGNQSFSFRTDTLPNYISAQYNTSTNTWQNVNFYYVGRKNNDNYISDIKHLLASNGDIYMCGRYDAPYIIMNTDTIIRKSAQSNPFFICKFNSNFEKIWSKQAVNSGVNTSLSNLLFGIDASDNLYISGTLGYVTGAISLDGAEVKNDTILDEYDYTYTDIFLYKLNSSGTVELSKTFLFRGTEQLWDMHVLADGNIYLCGDYSNEFIASPYGNFPAAGGGQYYNVFLIQVNGATGSINWGQPLTSNVYYSERLRNIRVDADENVYIGARFVNPQITFMGDTYSKRTDNAFATQILFAKINKSGQKQWAKVLGSTTSFDQVIEHQLYNHWSITDTTILLTVPYMSYGTNKDIEWGDTLIPTVKVPGTIFDNFLVISANSGDIISYFNRGIASAIVLNDNTYFGLYNDFDTYEVYKLTTKTNTISGIIQVDGAPLTNTMYTNIELISVMPGESGTVKSWAMANQNGEFAFDNVPVGGEYIISVVPYDATIMCGYYATQGYALWNNADTVRTDLQNDNLIVTLQKINAPTGTATIKGTIIIESLINSSISNIGNVQVILRTQQKTSNIVAFTRAYYDYVNMTDSYTYEFTNIPAGDYIVEVLYPFAESAETIPVTITQENEIVEEIDFKVVDDKILKRYSTDIPTISSEISVVYNKQTQTIDITGIQTPTDIQVYSIQGAKITQKLNTTNCIISLEGKSSGVYVVHIGNTTVRVVKN